MAHFWPIDSYFFVKTYLTELQLAMLRLGKPTVDYLFLPNEGNPPETARTLFPVALLDPFDFLYSPLAIRDASASVSFIKLN